MSNLGLGVMLQMLGGDKGSAQALTACLGKVITRVAMVDEALHISFEDGTKLAVSDDGQYCCESRYMTCDDNLESFVGDMFIGLEIKEAPPINDGGEDHECEFLEVQTNKGCFTLTNHNEHNGYYGGLRYALPADLNALRNDNLFSSLSCS